MSRYRATMSELMKKVYKEDGHQDVSSSKRMCKTIVEDAQQIEAKLNSMSPEDSLDTWWTNKLAVSANNLNKARDYIVNDIKEAKMVSDISGISITALRKEARKFNIKVDRVTPGGPFGAEYEVTFDGSEQNLIKYAKEHLGFDDKPGTFKQLKKHLAMEETDIEEISDKLKMKVKSSRLAQKIAKLKNTFLKKTIPGTGAMFAQKEEVELDEGKMKTIATMFDQGKSASEIAKALKLPVSTVKQILGEDVKEEVMVEFSDAMLNKLAREYEPLKGKSISVDQANKLRKIFNMVPDRALDALRRKKIPFLSGLALSRMVQKGMPVKEELEETPQGFALVQKAKEIAKKMAGSYTKAVKEIEKLQKGLSNNSSVKDALMKANESLEEKIKPFMISYSKNGKHAGFEDADNLPELQRKAASLRGKGFTIDKMGRYNPPVKKEETISEADINVDNVKKGDSEKEKELKIKLDKEKDQDSLEKQLIAAQGQINILKQKLENEKNKALKPEPNRETGEVPLTVGVAYKHFKDKAKKEDVQEADLTKSQIKKVHDKADELPKDSFRDRYGKKQGDSVRYAVATNMVKKKLGIKEDRRLYVETIAGLKKKAEKSGMPYSILKKVYDRGMAAWKGGHRPGASQQQWAFARVNSFVTKSSGTWGGADKDLAKQVRGSK